MNLAYARVPGGNLGDDLNTWLWPRLIGDVVPDDVVLFGIGTILNAERGNAAQNKARAIHVFSSGTDEVSPLPDFDERWTLHCVRGPLTAERIGRPELAVGDGAYLLRGLVPLETARSGIGFMPHHKSEPWVDWSAVCERLGWRYISAKGSVDTRLEALNSIERLVTEAMHGAIVADALRVPWIPVRFSPRFGEAKWQDFARSMELEPKINTLPLLFQRRDSWPKLLENVAKRAFRKKTGRGPEKWERLIVTWPVAGEAALEELETKLRSLAHAVPTYLSTDSTVERVTNELETRLQGLREAL